MTLYSRSTIYSKPLANIKSGRLLIISKCRNNWCKIRSDKYLGWVKKNIFGEDYKIYLEVTLDAQNLSNRKYQTVFANGSTIASVKAIIKETSATSIKTLIAIMK